MIAALAVLVIVAAWAVYSYNRLIRLRNQVKTAWADIDVQLKRRHDLVPELVAAVKGYAGYERGVLTAVTELRAQAVSLTSPARLGQVEASLEKSLTQLFALKEAYPELKANTTFLELQRDLVEVEDNLQYARRFYNGAVRDYNTAIQRFPDMLIASAGGFTEREGFAADDGDRVPVQVDVTA
ncbi:MAG TPA: LemA family protein [Gemmatimonadaceae bacterium]|nr:LemA family protein [Gemmatimonadaceae bacterium]